MNRHYGDALAALNAITTAGLPRTIDVSSTDYTPPAGNPIKNIHVGTQGDLSIVDLEDNTVIVSNWVGWLDCGAKKVLNANTTASSITVVLATK